MTDNSSYPYGTDKEKKKWKKIRDKKTFGNKRSKYNLVECECGGAKARGSKMCRDCYKKRGTRTYRTTASITEMFRCIDCQSAWMPMWSIKRWHKNHNVEPFSSIQTTSREKALMKGLGISSKEDLYVKKNGETYNHSKKIQKRLDALEDRKKVDFSDYDDDKVDCAYCLRPVPQDNQNPTKDECQHKRDDWSKVLRETRDERIKNGEWFGHHKSDWRRTMTEKHDTDKCACGNDKRKSSYQCFECFRKPGGWEKSVSKGESLLAQGYKHTYTNPRKGKKKKKKKD